jgi:hypothetical protein
VSDTVGRQFQYTPVTHHYTLSKLKYAELGPANHVFMWPYNHCHSAEGQVRIVEFIFHVFHTETHVFHLICPSKHQVFQ